MTLTNYLGGPDNTQWNQSGSEFVAMQAGNFVMGVGDASAGIGMSDAGQLGVLGVGFGAVWHSPRTAAFPTNAFASLMSGTTAGTPGTVNYPALQVDGDVTVQGAVVAHTSTFDTPSWRSVPEVWQTPAYTTNWSAGTGGFNGSTNWAPLQWRKDAQDTLTIIGSFKAGTTAPGSTVFMLPVGYRPKRQWPVLVQRRTGTSTLSMGYAAVSASGNFLLLSQTGLGVVAGDEFLVSATIPLGNIA